MGARASNLRPLASNLSSHSSTVPAVVVTWGYVEAKLGTPVIRRTVIIVVGRSIIIWIRVRQRIRLALLVHVKIELFRNVILGTEQMASAEQADLRVLVGREGQSLDHVIRRAKVVEGAIRC